MKCPFCNQDFSDNIAEVHIPWCKEQKAAGKKADAKGNKDPDSAQKNSGKNVNTEGPGTEVNSIPPGESAAKQV